MKVVYTGTDGVAETTMLAGTYNVHVYHEGYASGLAQVSVVAGGVTEITVYLDKQSSGARDPRLNISGTPRNSRLNIGG